MNNETQSNKSIFRHKKALLCAAVVIGILLLILAGLYLYIKDQKEQAYLNYHATYLIVDGTEYRRDSTELDLSGKSILEFEKLKELTKWIRQKKLVRMHWYSSLAT